MLFKTCIIFSRASCLKLGILKKRAKMCKILQYARNLTPSFGLVHFHTALKTSQITWNTSNEQWSER